ncbi:hypothetical protein [Amycolatopsis sp. NPDC004169]|uniref:hypothetical protein n=1 Tax=Amycolatopsis sp. NPDC004169 TaxID=3154453 RepID=UPI0033B677D2
MFGKPVHHARYARPPLRWRTATVLVATAVVIGVADTLIGAIVLGAVAVLAALRARWVRAVARLEDILESELFREE